MPGLLLALPVIAFAHAKMTATLPADGDFVAAPAHVELTFDNPVTLTGIDLHTVDGETRELAAPPGDPARTFRIEVQQSLPTGEYYVVWKAIAADTHFSTGEFFFTVVD